MTLRNSVSTVVLALVCLLPTTRSCLAHLLEGELTCDQLMQNETSRTDHDDGPYQDLRPLYDYKHLLCLIVKRLEIGRQVALYKWQHKVAIFDASRERAVLAAVVAKANSSGLDPDWSSAFFQDQMEANRKIQEYLFSQWKCANVNFAVSSSVDLYATIRPQIDLINRDLIELAVRTRSLRCSEWCFPLTEFHMLNIATTLDPTEAAIFRDYALRNICQA